MCVCARACVCVLSYRQTGTRYTQKRTLPEITSWVFPELACLLTPITTATHSVSEEDTQLLRSNSTWLYLAFPRDSIHKTPEIIASSQETPCVSVSPRETQTLTTRLRSGQEMHIEMGIRHMKRCSTLLTIREMKIKLQWGTTSLWPEWPSLKGLQIINDGEDVGKRKPSYIVGRSVNWCRHCGEQYGVSLKRPKIELQYDPGIPLLGLYPEKAKTLIQKDNAPLGSQQHYLQQPRHGSNLYVHQRRNGWRRCGAHMQWDTTRS